MTAPIEYIFSGHGERQRFAEPESAEEFVRRHGHVGLMLAIRGRVPRPDNPPATVNAGTMHTVEEFRAALENPAVKQWVHYLREHNPIDPATHRPKPHLRIAQ